MKTFITLFVSACIAFSSSAQVNLQQGLVAEYNFNGNANDETGHGFNGTLYGDATANGVLDLGYNTSDYLTIPPQVLDMDQDFTIAFQVNIGAFNSGDSASNTFISASEADHLQQLNISFVKANNGQFQVWINGNKSELPTVSLIKQNRWFSAVILRKNRILHLYINVRILATAQCSVLPTSVDTIIVGQREGCEGGCFSLNECANSQIDNLLFYNRALNKQELLALIGKFEMKSEGSEQHHPFLYPDPASDEVNLSFPFSNNIIIISDIYGREILRMENENGNSAHLKIDRLPDGVYFVTIQDENRNYLASEKFAKKQGNF